MNKKYFFYGFLLLILFCGFFVFSVRESPTESKFPATQSKNDIHVVLTASSSTYALSLPEHSSVYEAMNILASTTAFRFKAKYYQSLGYFIEEINGVKNSGGFYWTLYVDGKYSAVGVSGYFLKDGDRVVWKYENNNSGI